jgi:ferredoxin
MANETWNVIDSSCISCGICEQACLCDAISYNDSKGIYEIDKDTCHNCYCDQFGCADNCPVGAIVVIKSTK